MTARTPEIVRTGASRSASTFGVKKTVFNSADYATVIMPAYAAHGFSALMGLINSGIRQHI